jgi:predicted nucleic acid-binding protein
VRGYILDACGLIALLKGEAGGEIVLAILHQASIGQVKVFMNKLNLLEVYYGAYRLSGKATADYTLYKITRSPILIIPEIADNVFEEAGRLKATYKISLADSIALAEASVSGCELLTSDHHEFDVIELKENIKFHWIR